MRDPDEEGDDSLTEQTPAPVASRPAAPARRWGRLLPWLVGGGLLVAVVYSTFTGSGAGLPNGTRAPELRLASTEGAFDLSAYRGRVVVVNFWASWCPPCRAEAPTLSQAHQKLARQNGLVLGIALDAATAPAAAVAGASLGMHYPMAAATRPVLDRYRVERLPTTYVVARNGVIVRGFVGAVSERSLDRAIEEAQRLDARGAAWLPSDAARPASKRWASLLRPRL